MERWSSQAGFILAATGAAVGLGNIWRFSAVLGENGGGAYLIPYFIAVFFFVLPLMILEIAMGRRFRGTAVSAFTAFRHNFRFIGWLICAVSFITLCRDKGIIILRPMNFMEVSWIRFRG